MAEQTGLLRRANYVRDLGMTQEPAKEVRIFGLAEWLLARFETDWLRSSGRRRSCRSCAGSRGLGR